MRSFTSSSNILSGDSCKSRVLIYPGVKAEEIFHGVHRNRETTVPAEFQGQVVRWSDQKMVISEQVLLMSRSSWNHRTGGERSV